MKRFFLVDTENIGKRFLPGIENLTNEDTVVIFHYINAPAISMDILTILANSKAHIIKKEMTSHRKNAMDFQICTYLGMLAGQHSSSAQYYIMSEDLGYGAAIEFINTSIDRSIVVKEIRNFTLTTKIETIRMGLDELLVGYPKKVKKVVNLAIRNTHSDAEFHNYLQNNLKSDGLKLYQLLKPYRETLCMA